MFSFSSCPTSLPAPKIVFNRLNGKKYHHPAPALPADNQQEESFTPAHEENVKFVYDCKEIDNWSDCQCEINEILDNTFHCITVS